MDIRGSSLRQATMAGLWEPGTYTTVAERHYDRLIDQTNRQVDEKTMANHFIAGTVFAMSAIMLSTIVAFSAFALCLIPLFLVGIYFLCSATHAHFTLRRSSSDYQVRFAFSYLLSVVFPSFLEPKVGSKPSKPGLKQYISREKDHAPFLATFDSMKKFTPGKPTVAIPILEEKLDAFGSVKKTAILFRKDRAILAETTIPSRHSRWLEDVTTIKKEGNQCQ